MIKVSIDNKAALAALAGMGKQVRYAARRALNETAKKVVEDERRHIASIFKGPTPRTLNAVKVFSGAKKDDLSVTIGVDDGAGRRSFRAQGKKGTIAPAKYLLAQIIGGRRAPKRFEKALIAIGAMDPGYSAVFAKRSNALDAYGNISGAKLNQIITYFRKTKVDGYGGKMSDARKMKMMKGQLKGMTRGLAYFRGGKHGRIDTKLPDGIWERHYNSDGSSAFIRPILIYVRGTNYKVRFLFKDIAMVAVSREWQRQFDSAMQQALISAI